jgi:hypothetical protein
MRIALASVALVSGIALVGCLYVPRSYSFQTHPFVGKRVALACLDVAVALTDDDLATAPVVRYSFGNRCTHSAIVDLGAVRAVGIAADGTRVALSAYDPRHEVRPLAIDGWWRGSENIMYTTASGTPAPLTVCVDVGAVEQTTAHAESWICMGATQL